ncbi:MAG: Ribose transport system permease protein rbsC [Frankiales bacterium]|nr:Ribose transport system permease protein rbsC [Frankiales bacterium]
MSVRALSRDRHQVSEEGPVGRPSRVDVQWRLRVVALPWAVAVVMLVVSVAAFPAIGSYGGLATLTPLLGVLVVASLGQSLVIGTGGIDLSVSSVVTLTGITFIKASAGQDDSLLRGTAAALAVGLVCGLVNGLLVECLKLNSLVVTLATGQVMLGVASIWFDGGVSSLAVPPRWATVSSSTVVGGVSSILLLSVVLVAVASVVLSYTSLRRRFTAASTGAVASTYQGVRATRHRVGAFAAAGLLYSLAGLVLQGTIGTPTLSLGESYQLATVVAVVLGGAALSGSRLHPGATVAGVLFLSLINQDVAALGIASGVQGVIQGLVLICAMGAAAFGGLRSLRRRRARSRPALAA